MPELPEVQTVVDTLRPRLLKRKIASVRLSRTDILTPTDVDLPALLAGRTVVAIDRRAKRIVFTLDDDNRFYIHLGMSGRLTMAGAGDAVMPHTHLVMDVECEIPDGGCQCSRRACSPRKRHPASKLADYTDQLRFVDPRRFGGIWWMGRDADDATLGPEPLTLAADDLRTRLAKTRRPIKSALLDQTLIAGLGNIYVDESLFTAGIHPLKPANRLSVEQIDRLSRAIKQVLRRAIKAGGSTLRDYVDGDGQRGRYQKRHAVYDRADQPCVTCKKPIKRIVLGGRSTHFCTHCQRQS